MRIVGSLVIAATALFATGIAVAATRHVMNVPLADGAVARVEYEGEVAPRVTIFPPPAPPPPRSRSPIRSLRWTRCSPPWKAGNRR